MYLTSVSDVSAELGYGVFGSEGSVERQTFSLICLKLVDSLKPGTLKQRFLSQLLMTG